MAKELHLHPGGELDSLLEEIGEAKSSRLDSITLYNLDLSLEVADALIDLIQTQLQRRLSSKEDQSPPSSFIFEVLGGKGFVDRLVEAYVDEEEDVKRELILQHSHPDGFDTSVFAALGMALDGRKAKYATKSSGLMTSKLRLPCTNLSCQKPKYGHWLMESGRVSASKSLTLVLTASLL